LGQLKVLYCCPMSRTKPGACSTTLFFLFGQWMCSSLSTLQRKSHLCIPFLGIARPQSQFPHSCVYERFIYSQNRSTYLFAAEEGLWEYINRSQTRECGHWDCGRAIAFLGIFDSNFRHWFFSMHSSRYRAGGPV
jgi:hypothetical protein